MPYLSIVIPLYNKEKEIRDTLQAIFSQSFSDYEVLIINDGSTDGSINEIKKFRDERIRIISQENAGVSSARNRGIDESMGEYILLLDADDTLTPDALDILKDSHSEDIILGSFIERDPKGNLYKKSINKIEGIVSYPYKSLCKRELFIRIGSAFIRKAFLDGKEGFSRDLTLYEDDEWNYRIIDGATVYSTPKCVLSYNRGESGLSRVFRPIEKDFVSIVILHDIKDKYKRCIMGDFVFRRFARRLQRHDWKGVSLIYHNNPLKLTYCLLCCIYRASLLYWKKREE